MTKFRHQQHDLMSFEFPAAMSKRKKNHGGKPADQHESSFNPLMYLDVSKALLHISFCNEHINPALMEELRGHYTRDSPFRVTVHRLIAKDHHNGSGGSGTVEKFSKEEVSIELPEHLLDALFSHHPDHQQHQHHAHSSGGKANSKRCRRRVQVDISQMVKDWYKYPKKNHGLLLTTEPAKLRSIMSTNQSEHVSDFVFLNVRGLINKFCALSLALLETLH